MRFNAVVLLPTVTLPEPVVMYELVGPFVKVRFREPEAPVYAPVPSVMVPERVNGDSLKTFTSLSMKTATMLSVWLKDNVAVNRIGAMRFALVSIWECCSWRESRDPVGRPSRFQPR